MILYDFTRLLCKYSVTFQLVRKTGGEYVGGKWVEGETVTTTMKGAITPYTESKIYQSGGVLTTKDRVLYLVRHLEAPLTGLEVIYGGNVYSVQNGADYGDYGTVATYTLKWVSSFNGGDSDNNASNE